MRARRFLLVGIATAAMSLVLAGCEVRSSTSTGGSATQQVKAEPTTARVDRRDIVGYRIMGGTMYLPENAQAEVKGTYSAPVETVRVKVGEGVNRGQVLIDLATPNEDANYSTAKQTYEAALAAYNQALAQYDQPAREAQRALDDARATEKALRQQTIPNSDATALNNAIAARQAAEDALKVAKANAQTNVLPYKQQLDAAKIALDQASAGRKQTTITSPITGTVVAINAQPGQNLPAQTTVARVVDLAALAIHARVTPDDAPFVKKGTKVVVTFSDYPDRHVHGTVRSVQALPGAVEGRTEYEATIDFDNSERLVKPEASVRTVGVELGRRKNVVAVPVDAVSKDSTGKPFVRVLENNNWKSTVVELGMTDGNFVEVKNGVDEGQTVQVIPGQGQWIFTTNLTTAK